MWVFGAPVESVMLPGVVACNALTLLSWWVSEPLVTELPRSVVGV